jgi:16S rRNA G966 N2-methylase RsmD
VAANLAATGLADRAVVRGGDALAALGGLDRVDVAFCDPPYRFDRWDELLGALRAGVAVLESDRDVVLLPPWRLARVKRYGSTVITFATQE